MTALSQHTHNFYSFVVMAVSREDSHKPWLSCFTNRFRGVTNAFRDSDKRAASIHNKIFTNMYGFD